MFQTRMQRKYSLSIEPSAVTSCLDLGRYRLTVSTIRVAYRKPYSRHWGKPSQERINTILTCCVNLEGNLRDLDHNTRNDPVAYALSYTGYGVDVSRRWNKHKNYTSQTYVMWIMRATCNATVGKRSSPTRGMHQFSCNRKLHRARHRFQCAL